MLTRALLLIYAFIYLVKDIDSHFILLFTYIIFIQLQNGNSIECMREIHLDKMFEYYTITFEK